MKKLVIVDFDGTIADSFGTAVDILCSISQNPKYKLSRDEMTSLLRNKSIKEVISEIGMSYLELLFLINKIRKEFRSRLHGVKPIAGMKNVLKKLHSRYQLVLLTSNNQVNTDRFLKKEGLDIFREKYYKSGIFGKDKMIKKILKKNACNLSDMICIGDEVRDIEACRKVGCDIIAVAWGYNSKELLAGYNPTYLVENPKDILHIL